MDGRVSSLVVVGGSAGGVEALTALAAGLPHDLDAAVCVVIHLGADAESRLGDIVSRAGPLSAVQTRETHELAPGRIYLAPPDHHLTITGTRVVASQGARENGFRPSIDVLFRSAATEFGSRTIGVVLSGARDDGVAGASAIGHAGGCVLVQDPADAKFATLPILTVTRDAPDQIVPLAELAPAIAAEVARRPPAVPVGENAEGDASQR